MGKDVIIALDFASREETLAFLDSFQDEKPFVKIGMELFYAEGPDIVRADQARAATRSFFDLKLHDIPNTVQKAHGRAFRAGCGYDQPARCRHDGHDGAPRSRA